MPVTAISLSTGCLLEGFGVTGSTVSAAVSAVAVLTNGVLLTVVVFASCEHANRGATRENAATIGIKLMRKLPCEQLLRLRGANTNNSKTRLLGKGFTGQSNSIGKLPMCAESQDLERSQYMFKSAGPREIFFLSINASLAATPCPRWPRRCIDIRISNICRPLNTSVLRLGFHGPEFPRHTAPQEPSAGPGFHH